MTMQVTDSPSRPMKPQGAAHANPRAHSRSALRAAFNGALGRCPSCGRGHLYAEGGRLQVVNFCPHCEEELYHHRANRMAPWFSLFLAGHVAVLLALLAEHLFAPGLWSAAPALVVWGLLTWLLLPAVKGAIVGLQWAWRLYGFQYAAMCKPRHPRRSGTSSAVRT